MEIKTLRVLLIEDSPLQQEFVKQALRSSGLPHEIIVFDRGAKGLGYLEKQIKAPSVAPVHLIILDLHLPDEHGLDVLQKIKEMPALRSLPVIVFTASEESSDIPKAYKLGGAVFLKKDGNLQTLIDIIMQLKMTGRIRY